MTIRNIFQYLVPGLLLALAACSKSDPFEGNFEVMSLPVLSDATPLDSKVKEMYNKYDVLFYPAFKPAELTYDLEYGLSLRDSVYGGFEYTVADMKYGAEVIDSVESWVFKTFPLDFSKKYLPFSIFMVDTLREFRLYSYGPRLFLVNTFTGYNDFRIRKKTMISSVSPRFDSEKGKRLLRESWLSLFVEIMLSDLPAPVAFSKISEEGYKAWITDASDVMATYALLKKSRLQRAYPIAPNIYQWEKTTLQQDFGDFVAFIVYTPEEEKQLAYAKNAAILTKVNLVKSYFKTNFNIELPYRPLKQ